jgi:hypothetical protein
VDREEGLINAHQVSLPQITPKYNLHITMITKLWLTFFSFETRETITEAIAESAYQHDNQSHNPKSKSPIKKLPNN